MTSEEARVWVQSWPERWTSETGAGWAALESGVLVGCIGFRTLNLDEGSGEAAYWVVPGARGRGVAGQALAAVKEWMFGHVGLHRLTLLHSTRNEGSCRVALKAGYRDGTMTWSPTASALRLPAVQDGALVGTHETLMFEHAADGAAALLQAAAAYQRLAAIADAMATAGGALICADDGLLQVGCCQAVS